MGTVSRGVTLLLALGGSACTSQALPTDGAALASGGTGQGAWPGGSSTGGSSMGGSTGRTSLVCGPGDPEGQTCSVLGDNGTCCIGTCEGPSGHTDPHALQRNLVCLLYGGLARYHVCGTARGTPPACAIDPSTDVCTLPKPAGACASQPRFRYDSATHACEPFNDTQCGSTNPNSFATMDTCDATCTLYERQALHVGVTPPGLADATDVGKAPCPQEIDGIDAGLRGNTLVTLAADDTQMFFSVAVDQANVYWSTYAQVFGRPLAGGNPVVIAHDQYLPHALTSDGTYLYWTNTDGSVLKAPVAGGPWVLLATGPPYQMEVERNLVIDSHDVYWTNPRIYGLKGQVLKVPQAGGTVTTLASAEQAPAGMAVGRTSVFYGTLGYGPLDNPGMNGQIVSVPIGGGAPRVVATGQYSPNAIALDATSVYWTNTFGSNVMRASMDGGRPVTLAAALRSARDFVVDEAYAYVLHGIAQVMRVPLTGGAVDSITPTDLTDIGTSAIAVDCKRLYVAGYEPGNSDPGNPALNTPSRGRLVAFRKNGSGVPLPDGG
jgi:hypothetical protein